ncbi:MAG: phosphoribosyl-AMP cyclohydrolase [Actinomycetota bacterium]
MEFKFDDNGLIPAIIQDVESGEVLMLGYMNGESLARTIESGRTWFWSRSRQEFWCKGETSGNRQYVREIRYDCDQDALLVKVLQVGPACHTEERSCFYRVLGEARTDLEPGE